MDSSMARPPNGASGDEDFAFAPEDDGQAAPEASSGRRLQVLSVDDDASFQRTLSYTLARYRYQGQPVELLTASSAAEGARVLAGDRDIAVVLLDVVMESDDAGLRLVKSLREVIGNAEIRIVLLTGQPGMAPMQTALDRLDINDYWLKTELTTERLYGVLTSALRAWEQLIALSRARRGLQMIVEASSSLIHARSLQEFSTRVVQELARLLGLTPEGIVCVQEGSDGDPLSATIVGAAGRFGQLIASRLSVLEEGRIRQLLARALEEHRNMEDDTGQVLYFPGGAEGPHGATYLATRRPLDATEHELLRVFASNINAGLVSIALVSRLDRMAFEDELLGMPNANALVRVLEEFLAVPPPRDHALLLIDLDQYSESCLSLGISQGDQLLRRMANRLRRRFPSPAVVARLHDDTFGILGPGAMLGMECVSHLEAEDPDDPDFPPFISVCAARIDLDHYNGSARSAMAVGSLLLKQARRQGLSQIIGYEAGMEVAADKRYTLSHDLYHALRSDEIHIALQPQVDLASGRVVGAEALARWTKRDGTSIPPSEFIPMAEANGLIVPLGRRIIELACIALARLGSAGFGNIPVAVNVSALQLARDGFLNDLRATVELHGLPPSLLEIEVTESIAMDERTGTSNLLEQLRDTGFPLAIDDFGTGYSSLSYLRSLPATTLKIDRSFVHEIGNTPERLAIADMIIRLGQRFDMRLVAEGVETPAQRDWLTERGCHQAQGYLFGRPQPLSDLMTRLKGWQTNP